MLLAASGALLGAICIQIVRDALHLHSNKTAALFPMCAEGMHLCGGLDPT